VAKNAQGALRDVDGLIADALEIVNDAETASTKRRSMAMSWSRARS